VNPERAIAYRKQVGALLEAVLADEVSPRAALNCWPMEGNRDPSVLCAYTMVWYFEADEDRHHEEMFYADLQIKTLQEASIPLKAGHPLPSQLLAEYQAYTAPSQYADRNSWRDPLLRIQQEVSRIKTIVESNPWFQRNSGKTKGPSRVKGPFG
jgi:hypothetical protein